MTAFQIIASPASFLLAARSVVRVARRERPRITAWLGVLVWTLAGLTVLSPELTTRIARLLGIGRGADLLIYLLALAFLSSWFYFYRRLRSLSDSITALTRAIALERAKSSLLESGVAGDEGEEIGGDRAGVGSRSS